jgi:hypothetical protein
MIGNSGVRRDLLVRGNDPEELMHHIGLGTRELQSERFDFDRAREMYDDLECDRLALQQRQLQLEDQQISRARAHLEKLHEQSLKEGFAHLSGPMRQYFMHFYQTFKEEFHKEQLQVAIPEHPLPCYLPGNGAWRPGAWHTLVGT